MRNSNTFDLKTNIVSTVIITLLAILVAVISSTIIANSMKPAGADQSHEHQVPTVSAASTENSEAPSCDAPSAVQAAASNVPGTMKHTTSGHKHTHTNSTTNTTNNSNQTINNGNVSNSGEDNDLVDIDDLADVNVPVNVLNNALNGNSVLNNNNVLNDVLDVQDNNLQLGILSNLL